ncbi:cobalamin biosynthesis protein [Actinoplanes utahensis]|uniref:cobalamin biosynthesis protein n=1 Tax=Actinoplanes utahensis TaxID=1869 RepID=UPI000AECBD5D|nr:cobalamin biosynthesis protein [Actinoplanes utahensis]GIF27719.1 hypothetical protein Aut01nite_07050 [Actinoplanes utahensis]
MTDLVLGLGARSGVPAGELAGAIRAVLAAAGVPPARVGTVATLDRRAAEPGVRAFARAAGWRLTGFAAAALAGQPVFRPSGRVAAAVGTPGVAEAAALLAAGPGAVLVLPKQVYGRVTVALAATA